MPKQNKTKQNCNNTEWWQEFRKAGSFILWKTVWQIHIKLIMHLPFDLETATLGIYLREMKGCIYMFIAALFTIAKKVETT